MVDQFKCRVKCMHGLKPQWAALDLTWKTPSDSKHHYPVCDEVKGLKLTRPVWCVVLHQILFERRLKWLLWSCAGYCGKMQVDLKHSVTALALKISHCFLLHRWRSTWKHNLHKFLVIWTAQSGQQFSQRQGRVKGDARLCWWTRHKS